jgi:mannose-1-phosphate guanylyltransferase
MTESPIDGFVAVVPAGGVGSRLWPLSRPEHPKFLLDLLGTGSTLLQATLERLAPLTSDLLVVTGAPHADAVLTQLPQLGEDSVLAEPSPRDSMAAIALAAAVVEQRLGARVIGSFAADHVIGDLAAFRESVRTAVITAEAGFVVTIGIEPTEPSTAFGYIELGAELSPGASRVHAFTEKPDADTATAMLERGGFAWNAGMFVVRTDVLLGHLDVLQPSLAAGVRRIAAAWDTPGRDATLAEVWPTLTRIAIDHAIAEPIAAQGGVAVVPASFGWYDVGDFASLAALLQPDADGVTRVGGAAAVRAIASEGLLAIGTSKPLTVVGLDDLVVVETADAVLITSRANAQAVKEAATPASAPRS